MVSAYTMYFLQISTLATVLAITFVILLFRQFIKKRTLGTILLAFSFVFIAIAELFMVTSQYLYVYVGDYPYLGHLQLSFIFTYGIAYVFFYYFSNRHILRDKDFLKASTTIFTTAIISSVISFMISD